MTPALFFDVCLSSNAIDSAWSDFLKFCKVAGIVIISALGVSWALAQYNECDRGDHGDQQELRPFTSRNSSQSSSQLR
jgi:hypothetical protein